MPSPRWNTAPGPIKVALWPLTRFLDSTMKLLALPPSLALAALAVACAAGCKPPEKKAEAHPSPAKVDKVQKETDLNMIVLTAEAEQRLGLTTAPVEMKDISR